VNIPLRNDARAIDAVAFANVLLLNAGDRPVPLNVLSPFMNVGERGRRITEGLTMMPEGLLAGNAVVST